MFTGSLVALVTPMNAEGEIDWSSLSNLIDWHIQEGTDAIVAVGTTGESATLSVSEHIQVIAKVIDQVQGKIPVIAGTGANSTREAIEWTEEAKVLGADAALLVTPYYNKPTQAGLFQHFSTIAKAVSIPQILYNVPSRTACDLLPETVIKLSAIDNIVAIKEATGDIQRGVDILNGVDSQFALYSGDDGSFVDLMAIGAVANISVTANIVPKTMADICRKAIQGDLEMAHALNQTLKPLHQHLFVEANPIPVKWAMQKMGKISEGIRLPLTPLSEQYHAELISALQSVELV